jgi:hypothetical protein
MKKFYLAIPTEENIIRAKLHNHEHICNTIYTITFLQFYQFQYSFTYTMCTIIILSQSQNNINVAI